MKQMSNYYAPCFYIIDFVIIPFYIELPWSFILYARLYFFILCMTYIFFDIINTCELKIVMMHWRNMTQ